MRTSTNNFQISGSFAYSFVAKDGLKEDKEPKFDTGKKQKQLDKLEVFTVKDFDDESFIEIVAK
jgi:hypothetical protein